MLAALAAAERLQPVLNIFTLIDHEAEPGRGGAMAGMPIALKDLIDQAGRPTTCGSGFYRRVPDRSAPVVDRLQAAGAVIIGRTGLHEFAYGFSSENHWFGPVRNPWDPTTSPGGSSGGSAVAVAAGVVPAAVGTDTGGSIRVPAALTGIMGLKVTHGRIPTQGVFPLAWSLDTVGPLARTLDDLALCYQVMAGLDPRPVKAEPVGGLRIALPQPWIDAGSNTDPVMEGFARFQDSLQAMEGRMLTLRNQTMLPFGKVAELLGAEAAHIHRPFLEQGQPYGPEVEQRLRVALAVSPADYLEAQRWRCDLQAAFAAVFRHADLIITPTVPALSKVIGQDRIGDSHYRTVLSWYSALVNHAGCPAISLPLRASGAPPPSVQMIAPWWREDLLLGLAATLEEAGVVGFSAPPLYAS